MMWREVEVRLSDGSSFRAVVLAESGRFGYLQDPNGGPWPWIWDPLDDEVISQEDKERRGRVVATFGVLTRSRK